MPLRVVSCFTYRTTIDSPWTDAEYSVNQFVDALKERSVRGYGHVRLDPSSATKQRIDADTAHLACDWFGQMGAQILNKAEIGSDLVLVPVPNSDCVRSVAQSRTVVLAEAVKQHSPLVNRVADILCWDQPILSASLERGSRNPSVLYPHLMLRAEARVQTKRPHVLIDDVLTTGGHIRACAAFLRHHRVRVVLVIVGARSDPTPQDDPFARRRDELDDFTP